MNQLFKTMVMASSIIFSLVVHGQEGTINDTERDFLRNYLNVSLEMTKQALQDVDKELWAYKPSGGGWSIGECMEHIMLAENALFKQVQGSLQKPANNDKFLARKDGFVITKTTDRGKKVTTPLKPQTVSMSKKQYIKTLENSRETIISFIQDPAVELRNHFGKSPFGEVDTYQLILIIAGHGMRHTAQIQEVIEEYTGTTASKYGN